MRFNIDDVRHECMPRELQVGDVYPMKGGRGPRGVWVIVGMRNRTVYLLGVGEEGQVISSQSYGAHCFEEREPIGRCDDVADLTLTITRTL